MCTALGIGSFSCMTSEPKFIIFYVPLAYILHFLDSCWTFLAPKWPLASLGTILRGQKSLELLKNPSKGPIKCFSRIKKKLSRTCRISSILIVIMGC